MKYVAGLDISLNETAILDEDGIIARACGYGADDCPRVQASPAPGPAPLPESIVLAPQAVRKNDGADTRTAPMMNASVYKSRRPGGRSWIADRTLGTGLITIRSGERLQRLATETMRQKRDRAAPLPRE